MSATRAELIARLQERYDEAARTVEAVRELRIANATIRLRFAGDGLLDAFMPALGHLIVDRAAAPAEPDPDPDLTVCLWTTRDTGVAMIDAPWPITLLEPGGVIPGATAIGLFATVRADCGLFMCVDLAAKRAFVWIADAAALDWHDRAAPLRQIFTVFFEARGLVVTHAGAVGIEDAGVLLGGRGGSGKSTTSLLCLAAGFAYASDDYVLVDVGDDGRAPWAYSLYATGKVLPQGRIGTARLGALGAAFDVPPPDEKAIAWLHGRAGATGGLSRGFRLVAVLMPRVTGDPETHATPMSGGLALRLLAPSTVFQQQGDAARALAAMSRLVRRLPCMRLELGTDLDAIPELIAGIIRGAR